MGMPVFSVLDLESNHLELANRLVPLSIGLEGGRGCVSPQKLLPMVITNNK